MTSQIKNRPNSSRILPLPCPWCLLIVDRSNMMLDNSLIPLSFFILPLVHRFYSLVRASDEGKFCKISASELKRVFDATCLFDLFTFCLHWSSHVYSHVYVLYFFAKSITCFLACRTTWVFLFKNKKILHHDKVIPINHMLQQLSGPKINNNSVMAINLQWNSIISQSLYGLCATQVIEVVPCSRFNAILATK